MNSRCVVGRKEELFLREAIAILLPGWDAENWTQHNEAPFVATRGQHRLHHGHRGHKLRENVPDRRRGDGNLPGRSSTGTKTNSITQMTINEFYQRVLSPFYRRPPPPHAQVLPPAKLPADTTPEGVPVVITDTSSRAEDQEFLHAACRQASVIVLCFRMDEHGEETNQKNSSLVRYPLPSQSLAHVPPYSLPHSLARSPVAANFVVLDARTQEATCQGPRTVGGVQK